MNILLLTKSVSFEQSFSQQLNFMGHEVFSSNQLLKSLEESWPVKSIFDYFDAIIFSETVSNEEVRSILSEQKEIFKDALVFRKTSQTLNDEEQQLWKHIGIFGFISKDTSFETIRDLLFLKEKNNLIMGSFQQESSATLQDDDPNKFLEFTYTSLSSQERTVFNILWQSKDEYVTREELAQSIWGGELTKSKESRLSGIIKNVNKKLVEAGFFEYQITTSWGKGYKLGNSYR
ncbi:MULTISPECIES: helix-turn-helix domain-containing protein [Enterococcus]|uniref:Helix-turn-helix domain-containing protein n=1 Tax=Enterococcus alishanensis TaxID=1303817 RepID=A0ABS6TG34_9ENTE|nr:helix-turn-helix domain-containing protein [Enterococcus alishanensis]MBV7391895.1 helix-turn-helix domain-containing protein [Enterococcus alishanensis]